LRSGSIRGRGAGEGGTGGGGEVRGSRSEVEIEIDRGRADEMQCARVWGRPPGSAVTTSIGRVGECRALVGEEHEQGSREAGDVRRQIGDRGPSRTRRVRPRPR
jgi:hypothetical protein